MIDFRTATVQPRTTYTIDGVVSFVSHGQRAKPSPASDAAHDHAAPTHAKPLVLLVEDFDDTRLLYAHYLSARGYRVEEATKGNEALEKAFAVRPDIILMDLSLPGLDGWEATRILKHDDRTRMIPILVVTAHPRKDARDRAFAAGCDAFLTKPCLPKALEQEIARVLGHTGPPSGREH